MADDARHDLLLGLIALQAGLIDEAQLVAAFRASSGDRSRPLADHLMEVGGLDAEGRAAVEALAALHVKKHGGDPEKTLAAISAGVATRDRLVTLLDPELTVEFGRLAADRTEADAARIARDPAPVPGAGTAVGNGQRFRILRPHAEGGLGAVFVAIDGELHREVALKRILDSHADDPESRQRFLLEAEITGSLEHPGIVPVYGLGFQDDGRPYYAMRFIRGESLKEAIDRYHRDPANATDPGRRSLGLRELLGRFVDVCNAIDYAHSRGVLHRDIKPNNIIVGRHGETLIVDWGIAKVMGKSDPAAGPEGRHLAPNPDGGTAETLPGSTLGTPSYMSPEQAAGDLDRLGPSSDIYSLGATLYCLLTGRPPFEGSDLRALLPAVREGSFPPPREADPTIDRALEAICLKAMAGEPAGRYASARELARDIERWMADEAVAAYREGRPERLGRWLRRHRTWTFAAVAALIGIAAASSVGIVVVERGRRRESEARALAQRNFRLANAAVRDYLTGVSQNTLLKEQDSVDIRDLRRELLETALKYYQEFLDQRSDDPELRRELAEAHFRVGSIAMEIGTVDRVLAAFEAARAIWEELAASHPDDAALHARLAECHLAIGAQLNAIGQFRAAMASIGRALAILQPLTGRFPNVTAYRSALADGFKEMGFAQTELGSPDRGLAWLERAEEIERALIGRSPKDAGLRQKLAYMLNFQGYVHFKRRDDLAALRSFREVQGICESLLAEISSGPRPVRLLDTLALAHYNIATIELAIGRPDAALASFERSLEYRSALVEAHPSVLQFRVYLANSLGEIALVLHRAGRGAKAFALIRRAIELLEALVREQPDQSRFRGELARDYNILGFLHDEARDNARALPAFLRSVAEQERAVAGAPLRDLYREELSSELENLGEQYFDMGRPAEGLPHYRRALATRRGLLEAHRGDRAAVLQFAEKSCDLGSIERHAGDPAAARETYARAREALEPVAAAAPGDAALQCRLGAALAGEALALSDQGRGSEALPILGRAVAILGPFGPSAKPDDPARGWLTESLWEIGRLRRASGSAAEADRLDAGRLDLWKDRAPRELAKLALQEVRRAAIIGYGKTALDGLARSVRDRDLDQAADNLRMAVSLGFREFDWLRDDPDSWLLLSRADVRRLIGDVGFPDQPFEPEHQK